MFKYALPVFLSLAALASPAAAQNGPQLTEDQVTALARYAMPMAFQGVQQKCTGILPSESYIYAHGDALTARLETAAIGQFEPARDALLEFASEGNEEMGELFKNMPAEVIEPLLHELLVAKVQTDVKEEQCSQINRGLELLDPLPAENIAEFIGFIVNLVQEERANEKAIEQ